MNKTKIVIFCLIFLFTLNVAAAVNIDIYPNKLYFKEVLSGRYAEK